MFGHVQIPASSPKSNVSLHTGDSKLNGRANPIRSIRYDKVLTGRLIHLISNVRTLLSSLDYCFFCSNTSL
jgi:hypothetical protein